MASSSWAAELQRWLASLQDEGWLCEPEWERLRKALSEDKPLNLPPLFVAFFGGTGVGKSTLLNRLAGGEIAPVSPLRPTSREVTVYLHRELDPALLPVGEGRIIRHDLEKFRRIVWIDTPDLDSIEPENRKKALLWLPFVDVVVYVVDPERYRDDRTWQLLLKEGNRHGWLFVMNHWDSGCELQIEDFRELLKEAGFEDPMILRCDNRPEIDRRKPDDFAKLEAVLQEVAAFKGQEIIRDRRQKVQRHELAGMLAGLSFGSADEWQRLKRRWQEIMEAHRRELFPLVERFSQTALLFRSEQERWFLKPLDLALDRLLVETASRHLPHRALENKLTALREELPTRIDRIVQQAVFEALRRPGGRLRALTCRAFEKLRFLLPFLACGWIAYQVVVKYYQGFFEEKLYLGDEFAIHSAMLLLVAWLLPELAYRFLRPSTDKRRQVGVELGLKRALDEFQKEVEALIEQLEDEGGALDIKRQFWISELRVPSKTPPRVPYLNRMLPRDVTAA